jgi:pyruvate/2-oxoacid:ferredoxin oxidoreductase alpha subunit
VILWGSTWGAAHEAILQVEEREGLTANTLEFPTIFPFHVDETLQLLRGVKQSLAVEGNFTGQFCRLLRAETGYKPDHFYGRYDGEPFAARDIADKMLEVVA